MSICPPARLENFSSNVLQNECTLILKLNQWGNVQSITAHKHKKNIYNWTILCRRSVLEQHRADGLDRIGSVKWSLALCLLAVFLLVYFSLWKGVRSTGMVSLKLSIRILNERKQISAHALYFYSRDWARLVVYVYINV